MTPVCLQRLDPKMHLKDVVLHMCFFKMRSQMIGSWLLGKKNAGILKTTKSSYICIYSCPLFIVGVKNNLQYAEFAK